MKYVIVYDKRKKPEPKRKVLSDEEYDAFCRKAKKLQEKKATLKTLRENHPSE